MRDLLEWRVLVPEGDLNGWHVRKFTVDERGASLHNLRDAINGRGRPIQPGTYTELREGGQLWMSDTPAEVADLLGIQYVASGAVLVVGLGIGVTVKMILAKPQVTSIDVLELSPEVLALVGPSITDPRVTLVNGDAFTYRWPKGKKWDYVWLDIWPYICADNLTEISRLRRRYARRSLHRVRAWCEAECRRIR